MNTTNNKLIATSARLSPENIQWLKEQGLAQERSANWVLNNIITEARLRLIEQNRM